MKNNLFNRPLAIALAIVSTLLTGSLSRAADTLTWSGGSGTSANWSDALNWLNSGSAHAVPVAGDNLIFSGSAQTINTDDITGLAGGWLQFANGDFWLNGATTLTLSGVTNISGANVFFMPLALGAAQVWDQAGGSSLAVSNTLTLGASALAFNGDGDATLAGVVSGTGSLTQNGAGSLTLVGANTHTGGLTVNAGTVYAWTANGTAYGGVGNGSLVVNNTAIVNVEMDNALVGQGTTVAPPRSVTINAGATVQTSDRSGHMAALILNGGTLGAGTARADWGNWNLDYGVSTPTNGSVSTISGGNVTLGQTGGTVFNIGAGDTVNVSSVIAHTTSATDLGLIKSGAGLLALSVANSYTSPTTVREGRLALAGGSIDWSSTVTVSTNGVFDVTGVGYSVGTNQILAGVGTVVGTINDNNAGAGISPGGMGAAGPLTLDTLNLNGNLGLNFDLANVTTIGGYVNDLLLVTNLTLSSGATNVVSFNFLKGTPLVGGVYTLIQYTNCSSPAGVVTTLASAPTRYTFTFTNDTSVNAIKVIVGGNPATLVWKGDGVSNLWDIVTTKNWLKNGTTPDLFYQADNVTFNDVGANTPPVNIVAAVQPTTVTVNSANNYMFSGPGKISGSATLIKSGTGTLFINTVNDYVGVTTVNDGALNLQVAGAVASPVTLNSGAVNVNVAASLAGQSTINGGILTINVANGATGTTNTVNSGGNLVLNAGGGSGSAQGTINVNAGGTNTLLAGNAYGYSGTPWVRTLNINGGLVDDQANGDNGWGITINMTGGELRSNNGISASGAGPLFSLGGGSSINVLANATSAVASGRINLRDGNPAGILPITVADGAADPDFLVTAAITSNYATNVLAKNGPGNMIFTGNNTYNSPTVINAGTLQIGAGGTSGAIGTGNITNNAALIFNRSDALTVSAPIYGTGTVENVGTGALLLNGASTYTGATTISAGTLQGSGTINSPVTVLSGANLSAGAVLGTGTLTVSNATVNAGAGLVIDLSSTAATSDLLAARGTLTLASPTPVTFNFLGGTPYTGGPYTIITNWIPRSGTLSWVNPTRYSVNLDNSQANRVQVTFTGTNANLVWKGNVNNLWNVNTDANWLSGGAATTYYQSDVVIFDDNGLGQTNVTLAGDTIPASVTVNSIGNYSFSGGTLGSAGNLIKSGSGTLTLANSNVFFGSAVLNAGTLQIGNGGTTGVFVGNIADYSSLVFNRSDAATFTGVISGPGTLTQAGTGPLLLSGNNTFFGGATVNAGTTVQAGNGALVDSGLLGIGPVNNLGSIIYNRASQIAVAAPHTGNGSLTFLGTGGLGQSSYSMNATNTFTGPVTLSFARLIGNLGALSLGSPSNIAVQQGSQVYAVGTTYSPVFNIPLTLSGTGWRESSGLLGALRLNTGAIWAGPITLAGNTRITAYNDGNSNVITGTITGGGYQLEVGASGGTSALLTLAPAAANTFGSLLASPGTLVLGNANAVPNNIPLAMNGGTLQLNGNSRTFSDFLAPAGGSIQNGSSTTPATVTLNPSTDVIYSGTFTNGGTQPLALVKNGGARLTLTGRDAATGGVTVNGGTLALGSGGGNGCVVGNVTMQPGTLLLSLNNDSFGYNGGVAQVTNLNLNGATLIHAPANNLTLWNNLTINMTGGYMAATNAATLPSTGARLDLGTGAGVNTLASANSSTIAGGNLYLRQANTVFNVADGAAADDLVISAPINQAATGYGITKNGAGRLKITGPVAFTGALTINGGSVVLGASSPLTSVAGTITLASGTTLDASAAGGLTLNSGQTLQGIGTVTGNVTDGSSTVISGGSSTGTLTVNGSLTLNGSGSLALKLANVTTVGGGVNDLIQVNGALSLNDSAPTPVNFTFLNGPPAAGSYTIMKYTGALTGTTAGLTNTQGYAVTFTVSGGQVQATFAATPPKPLVWAGDGVANEWNTVTTSTNWLDGSTLTNFNQFDSVTFDASSANTNVSIIGEVVPSSIIINGDSNYWITAVGTGSTITGTNSITKNGAGTAMLDVDPNPARGPITVNGGILTYGSRNNSYAGATTITVATNAAFDFGQDWDMTRTQPHNFVVQGSGPDGLGAVRANQVTANAISSYTFIGKLTLAGDTVLGAEQRWDIGGAWAEYGSTIPTIDGQGFSITKVGSAPIDVRSVVTNVSSITVSNGYLFYENYDQTNSWTATTTNFVKPGARLGNYGGRSISMPIVLDGATIQNEGGGTPVWLSPIRIDSGSVFYNGSAQYFYGPISGPGAMWVNGGISALTVTNANTYAGGTVISNAPVTTSAADATSGSAAVIAANPAAFGTGPITINGLAYPSLSTNTSFFLTNVLRAVEFAFGAPGTVANNIVLPSVTINNVSLHGRDNSQVVNLTGVISGGFAGMTNWIDFGVAGNGVIRYANPANTFLGTISAFRGWLAITGDGSLGNSANLLRLNTGSLRIDAPGINIAHNITLTGASTLNLFGDNNGDGVPETVNDLTISGIISGGSALTVRGTNGTLTLSGANTYTSGFELLEPVTLQVGASANLGTAYVAIKAGSTFRYTGTGSESMTRTIWNDSAALGGGTIDIPNASANLTWTVNGGGMNQNLTKTGAGALTLGGSVGISGGLVSVNAGSMTISSAISGNTVVQVNSTGTLTLAGNNSYVGPTLVNAGKLLVNGSLPAANAVTVASGATLGGTGTINCPVALQAGSALQPGAAANSIGTLTVKSPLALSSTTATTMEINGTSGASDAVVGMSTVTYGGTLTVNNIGGDPAVGAKFTLFSAVERLGSFTTVNLPTVPAPYYWTNTLAVDGSIQLMSTINLAPVSVTWGISGGNLNLSWPTDHIGWKLLVQTNNLNLGVSINSADWGVVAGSSTTNQVSIPIDTAKPTEFYRLVSP